METPETITTSLQIGEWVISRDFKDAYFHIPQEHAFSHPGSVLPVESPTLWSVRRTHGVHSGGQRHQTDGFTEGYKNPPVPRRLVGESHIPPNLSPAYTHLGSSLLRTRLADEQGKVRTGSKTGFQLCRLPGPPQTGKGQTNTRALADLNKQDIVPGPAVYVPDRASNSHRKTSPLRLTSYETHTVALEQLEDTRITRKGDTCSQIAPPPPNVVAGGREYASRSTITPTKTSSADINRRIYRRVGRSLKRTHCKGNLVPFRKQVAYKPLETVLVATDNATVIAYINKEGDEVRLPVCPTVENPVLVDQVSLSTSHPRPAERDSRQAIQTWPDHSIGVVPSSRGIPSYMLPVAPDSSKPVCHQIQQQTTTVCVTGPRRPGMGSGCTRPVMGRSGPICLPTSSQLVQGGGEVTGLPMQQNHTDCTRVAQHALVLGI